MEKKKDTIQPVEPMFYTIAEYMKIFDIKSRQAVLYQINNGKLPGGLTAKKSGSIWIIVNTNPVV